MTSLTREQRDLIRRRRSDAKHAELAGRPKHTPAVARAIDWLEDYLAAGPRSGKEVREAAAEAGIARKTLRRALGAHEGVVCTNGGNTGSTWRLR